MANCGTLANNVDAYVKTLKTKAFILEKFLDTDFRSLLRFLPESSDGFFEPPLELFSLERKGRPLPDGLFVCGSHGARSEEMESNVETWHPHVSNTGGPR
jgi:hypothetical protein